MRQSAADGLGKVSNPAPVRSDATRVTPRAPERNNPNAATISAQPSRARQALNTARNVSTTVDAIASAAEAGVSLRRGDVAGAVAGLGLAGAAAMGVRSARVARVANTVQDAGASARRITSTRNALNETVPVTATYNPTRRTVERSDRMNQTRETFRSSTSPRANTSNAILKQDRSFGGREGKRVGQGDFDLSSADPRNPVRAASSYPVGGGAEMRVGPKLSRAAIERDLSVARKMPQGPGALLNPALNNAVIRDASNTASRKARPPKKK
jgi:hypothetical protein